LLNLRDRARTLLQGLTSSPPAKVQSYSVVCSEGHRLRGQRTVGYQALRCPSCGDGVFVLPRSPLPEPPSPAPSRRVREPATPDDRDDELQPIALTDPAIVDDDSDSDADEDADGEVVWLDEEGSAVVGDPAEAGMEEIAQRSARQSPASVSPAAPRPARRRPSLGAGPRVAVAAPGLPTRLVRWAGNHRNVLLFLAVGFLILATFGIRQWRQYRQDLPRVAALGRVEGLAALEEGEFDKAYQLLSRARHAVDALGGAVEGAAQIRQGAAEAEIFVRLVPDRLEAILDAAGRDDPGQWPSRFASLYRGRTIILDSQVIAVPDSTGQGAYELDYQVLPDGEGKPPRVARIDMTGFRLFAATQPKVGDQVTIGAKLASFRYDEQSQEWRIGLEPDSGVFLTHPKALQALGWPNLADQPASGPQAEEGPSEP
jgi:hypothetical protein